MRWIHSNQICCQMIFETIFQICLDLELEAWNENWFSIQIPNPRAEFSIQSQSIQSIENSKLYFGKLNSCAQISTCKLWRWNPDKNSVWLIIKVPIHISYSSLDSKSIEWTSWKKKVHLQLRKWNDPIHNVSSSQLWVLVNGCLKQTRNRARLAADVKKNSFKEI